ncbi:hypothetical protein ABIE26_002033 [Pedobacter africanus]|uniref:Uncharacterized protein n=1 Tax=Pedobacter africanus TaxID=151894 RepID=A0ACC6KQ84_9SPHI|nr:RagB/SusD family nutrient uptake outer membrane protein [Pedobacter africanus]MDR6781479.1 hypothetical protein [Pedobacter africanus]
MKRTLYIILSVACVVSLTGCKKYLDVTPKANISEEQLFTSEPGFQQALGGVYSQLASRNLYGDKLTMGFVSTLAQNYVIAQSGYIPLVETRKLNYESAEVQDHTEAIWGTAYAALAGINKILQNTEKNRAVLSDQGHALVRGEALALRALLHFDLLRLFGKTYATGANDKAIPYKTDVTDNINIPNTTTEVINFALSDLRESENLLKTADPIVTLNTRSRRNHLNYYGVKALEARIRLYMGDNPGAAAAAAIVINSGRYPFVTSTAASSTTARDRLYMTEQVFMVRVRTMTYADGTPAAYFRFNAGAAYKLTLSDANFKTLYENSSTDIRYLYRVEQDGGIPFPSKYWQTTATTLDSTRLDQCVPVIRLAEMYYILAETAPTLNDGFTQLNAVRTRRGLSALPVSTQATLNNEITKEYQKEFYAEGQLWFYYKRKATPRPQFLISSITSDLTPAKYVLPIPPTELQFNPNYN